MDDPGKKCPVTPCMDVYKTNIKYDGCLDKLKLRIVVGGNLHNTEIIGDNQDPTESIITLKYFVTDASKHKSRVQQLYFIGDVL